MNHDQADLIIQQNAALISLNERIATALEKFVTFAEESRNARTVDVTPVAATPQ
jgi:hypothetical protein